MLVEAFLRKQKESGADFCDFFAERVFTLSAEFYDGVPRACLQGHYHGMGIRIQKSDQMYYYQTSDLTPAGIYRLLRKILRHDEAGGPGEPAKDGQEPDTVASFWETEAPVPDDPHKTLSEISRGAEAVGADLRSIQCSAFLFIQDIRIIDSEGVDVSERRHYNQYHAAVRLSKNGRDGAADIRFGSRKTGLMREDEALNLGLEVSEKALEQLEAETLSPGNVPVILGPGSGALLMHEACGHPLEADYIYKKRSIFHNRLGDKVASPMITVMDDPLPKGPEGIRLNFDDEGESARPRVLIERGIIRNFLSDRRHVRLVPGSSRGNGRRQSYRDRPLPRMTNLVIKPGDASPEEMIQETRRGLYARELGAGKVDPLSGNFVFRIARGYEISDGRIGRPLRDMMLRGRIQQCLTGIDRVGGDFAFAPGFSLCEKEGQRVPVGMGQPTIRITSLDVGNG